MSLPFPAVTGGARRAAERADPPSRVRWLAVLLLLWTPPALAAERPAVERIDVTAQPITHFHRGHPDEKSFGALEFVGGLDMTGSSADFGAFSAFRFLEGGSGFIGVADTGLWFFGSIRRDAEGRPAGVEDFRMERMADAKGRPVEDKWDADAEGLAIRGRVATVGFEREHRLAQYRIGPDGMSGPLRTLDFVVPRRELRRNRGFETVAYSRQNGPLGGALIAVSEKSLDREGNIFGAVVEGPAVVEQFGRCGQDGQAEEHQCQDAALARVRALVAAAQ